MSRLKIHDAPDRLLCGFLMCTDHGSGGCHVCQYFTGRDRSRWLYRFSEIALARKR
jgi:hypothetical protein